MARAHLFRPVTDEAGNLLYGAQVTVRREDINSLLDQNLYAGPVATEPLSNPFVIHNGYIDIWLDTPKRVNFLIEAPPLPPISIYLDVHPPADEVLRTVYPLTITNQPYAGAILLGVNNTEASFQDAPTIIPGVAPAHDHDGAGVNSTALGTAATALGLRATAVGDSAQADFEDSTAFGYLAVAGAARATAVGASAGAAGIDSTAVGRAATAVDEGTAVGAQAVAGGGRAVAVGKTAQANGIGAIALGSGTTALSDGSVSIGQGALANQVDAVAVGVAASATHARSTAFGPGAATSAEDQVALGGAASTVVALGDLLAQGDATVAGAASTLGFFGSAGVARQIIPGVVSDPALAALLDILHNMGLIDDQTTV